MKNEAMFDYMNIVDQPPPPGAEGTDQGNGNANEYLMQPDTSHVPVESQLSNEEEKILKEAVREKKVDKTEKADPVPGEGEKKKKGFFKKLFGGKNKNENNE
jgi:penicillin-binding protein 1A